jgi:hypothetical protein
MHTRLLECPFCQILTHEPDPPRACPECEGALQRGLFEVGFDDARKVYGEPGLPWEKPPEGKFCKDGHKVHSADERVIDDWLHANGIPHQREPKLKGMRPDWRVGNVFVEYWGLAGQQGYEARREQKLALYKKRRYKLVELFPEDMTNLERKLGFLRSAPLTLDAYR